MTTLRLEGRTAIVCGAGRGAGAAMAMALAAAGAKVAVNDLNPDRARRVADTIVAAGGEAIPVNGDISNKFQASFVIETMREKWGRLDIVVNNAHVRPRDTLLKLDEWDWQRTLEVNLKGAFFMTQLCGRVMADENQARGGGVIIHIGSEVGTVMGAEGLTAFGASMAGRVGMVRTAALELAAVKVRVHSILRPIAASTSSATDYELLIQTVLGLCDLAATADTVVRLNGRN